MNRSQTTSTAARNVRLASFASQMERTQRAELREELDRLEMAELQRSEITARIKQARKEAGLSQPEMADALGVIPRTYQNYESQKDPRVPWGSMNEIAKITGKQTEWLIHGSATLSLAGSSGGGPSLAEINEKLDEVLRQQEVILRTLRASRRADRTRPSAPPKQSDPRATPRRKRVAPR